jgi:hypothetical protein
MYMYMSKELVSGTLDAKLGNFLKSQESEPLFFPILKKSHLPNWENSKHRLFFLFPIMQRHAPRCSNSKYQRLTKGLFSFNSAHACPSICNRRVMGQHICCCLHPGSWGYSTTASIFHCLQIAPGCYFS